MLDSETFDVRKENAFEVFSILMMRSGPETDDLTKDFLRKGLGMQFFIEKSGQIRFMPPKVSFSDEFYQKTCQYVDGIYNQIKDEPCFFELKRQACIKAQINLNREKKEKDLKRRAFARTLAELRKKKERKTALLVSRILKEDSFSKCD